MPQSRLNPNKIMAWYWACAVMLVVLACGVAGLSIYRDYAVRKHDAGQKAMMFAQAMAEQTTQIMASLDALSEAVKNDVTDSIVSEKFLSEVLRRRTEAETRSVIGITVLDRSGHVSASSIETIPIGTDLSHSREFLTLSKGIGEPVLINHPAITEISTPQSCIGQTMTYSRAITSAGRFTGIVMILVDEHYLYSFYDRFNPEPDVVFGLVGSDGVIRASNYSLAIGRNIKKYIEKELQVGQGIQVRHSPIVDYQLILAYYKSSASSLWAYSGFPTAPIRAAWMRASFVTIVALLTLFCAVVASGILLGKYLKSQKQLLDRDIGELKDKQEKEIFHTIAGASELLMVVTDAEGKIVVSNPNFQNQFSHLSQSERLMFKQVLGIDGDVLATKPSWQGTHTVHIPQNRKREISWVVSIIRNAPGNAVKNFVILGLDITERREAELSLYQSGKLVTLGQMATGIAHELSQPLATIAMMLDNLEHAITHDIYQPSDFIEQIKEMNLQIDRASAIASHMRVYGHRTDGALSGIPPMDVANNVLKLTEEQFRAQGIEIVRPAGDVKCNVIGNQIMIEQILLNLMVNARDSLLTKGNGKIAPDARISLQFVEENNGFFGFSVEDNGTGLAAEVKDKIFEPFFTTKPQGIGLGLGLALCHGMAKDMNGYIEAENAHNGAIFILRLPVQTDQDPEEI